MLSDRPSDCAILSFMPDHSHVGSADARLSASSEKDSFEQLVTRFMRPARLALCPELRIREATSLVTFWEEVEALAGRECEPPFWGWSWPGSQALARFLLDHPEWVRGKEVLDLGSGNGLSCLAAEMAGARRVVGSDIDPFAVRMTAVHAALNGQSSTATSEDLLSQTCPVPAPDVVLIGDLFYARELAARVERWARRACELGAVVLIGDPGRAYVPREGVKHLASYDVPVDPEVESVRVRRTQVLLMV